MLKALVGNLLETSVTEKPVEKISKEIERRSRLRNRKKDLGTERGCGAECVRKT